jgi:AraC-like DNA-binding protein
MIYIDFVIFVICLYSRMKLDTDILMHISHGFIDETVKSPRYFWDGKQRGSTPYVIFQWTQSGSGVFQAGGRTYEVGPGKAFLSLVPGDERYFYPKNGREPWVFSWMNFEGSLALELWGKLRGMYGPVIELSLSSPLMMMMREMIWKTQQRQWTSRMEVSVAVYRFFLEVSESLGSPTKSGREGLDWARSSLRMEFRSSMVMKELADQIGWSREHFSREYRRKFGVAPGTDLRELRLAEACRLLESTGWTIQEVAVRSGFSNATQLGVRFQKRFKTTPARYRAKQSKP